MAKRDWVGAFACFFTASQVADAASDKKILDFLVSTGWEYAPSIWFIFAWIGAAIWLLNSIYYLRKK